MRIDLRGLLAGETNKIIVDRTFSLDGEGEAFSFDTHIDGVTFTSPVHVTGDIVNMGGYIRLSINARVEYGAECARCLKKLNRDFTVGLERTVVAGGSLANTGDDGSDDYIETVNGELELAPVIAEELLMEFPTKEICSEDCKGLCPKCGKDLNEGDCGCPKKEIDPRLAILQKLLEKE